ncbi:MAG: Type 1 glutamine amidotransferase-like domain-containing protein, partial [Planctomycetaceae bacterium]|nr:Type 1 glutamine amidotransferase-like domain-containing protein [Planctomycetaceae bacterium]
IADAYLNTLTHLEFQNVLARGGVIAGSSAGASIQGSFLWRGDTKTPDILVGDHTQGLGFLKNSVIDQHILARNRQFDLIEFVKSAPQLIGLGIDESTAVIVIKDELEVLGKSIVAIHSYPSTLPNPNDGNTSATAPVAEPVNTNPSEPTAAGAPRVPFVRYSNGSADAYKPFLVLRSGQKYNLKERKVIQPERRFPERGGFTPSINEPNNKLPENKPETNNPENVPATETPVSE